MIHHIDFGVTDLARSRELIGFGVLPDPVFWIRNSRQIAGRLHLAFQAGSRTAVDAFHAAAVAAGGTDNGAPGLRPCYAEHYYSAYVLDPDGHNIEAVCRQEIAAP